MHNKYIIQNKFSFAHKCANVWKWEIIQFLSAVLFCFYSRFSTKVTPKEIFVVTFPDFVAYPIVVCLHDYIQVFMNRFFAIEPESISNKAECLRLIVSEYFKVTITGCSPWLYEVSPNNLAIRLIWNRRINQ